MSIQKLQPGQVTIADLADLFNGDPETVAVNKQKVGTVAMLLTLIAATTGTAKILAFACDNAAKDNPVAIDYFYRKSAANSVFGAVTKVEAGSEITTSTGATQQYLVWVDRGSEDKPFVYFQLEEVADDPVNGHVVLLADDLRDIGSDLPTVLT